MLEFLPYQTFPSAEAAAPFLGVLRQHNVPFETALDTGKPDFDPSMALGVASLIFWIAVRGWVFPQD